MKIMLGKKVGMTQIFEKNAAVPVTVLEAGPLVALLERTTEKDGYKALQVGYGKKGKKFQAVREFRGDLKAPEGEITVDVFEPGDKVRISAVSKGKGFQGVVKRHGFSGRNATHGVKHEHRTVGSVGGRFPQHVVKGRKMPGRTGANLVTVKNLVVVQVDKENNLLALRGAVPGRKGTLVTIQGME